MQANQLSEATIDSNQQGEAKTRKPEFDSKDEVHERLTKLRDSLIRASQTARKNLTLVIPSVEARIETLADYSALVNQYVTRQLHKPRKQRRFDDIPGGLEGLRQRYVNTRIITASITMLDDLIEKVKSLRDLLSSNGRTDEFDETIKERVERITYDLDQHMLRLENMAKLEDSHASVVLRDNFQYYKSYAYRWLVDYWYPVGNSTNPNIMIDNAAVKFLEDSLVDMDATRKELKKREDEEIIKPQEQADEKSKMVESREGDNKRQVVEGTVEELPDEDFPLADPEPNDSSLGIEVNL
mmetsp:Transcript_24377/g.47731  ORF Transcript_24377/g.47731 Transcript_24377/m.47731 type:complete len:298 (-) Transcript_24377:151-1044(-)